MLRLILLYTRFYYDFYFPDKQLSDDDLKLIKKEMDKIIKADYPIRREEVSRDEARYKIFHYIYLLYNFRISFYYYRARILAINEPYKMEILDRIKTEPITIYHIGNENY